MFHAYTRASFLRCVIRYVSNLCFSVSRECMAPCANDYTNVVPLTGMFAVAAMVLYILLMFATDLGGTRNCTYTARMVYIYGDDTMS